MKKNKLLKLAGIVLCLVMLLCMCVVSASAASTINGVEITHMDMPEEDMAADYYLEAASDDYIITNVVWFDQEKGQDMLPNERFKADCDYEVSIYLEAQNGYEFKFNSMGQPVVTAVINNSTEDVYVRGDVQNLYEIIVKRQFTISASSRITEISVSEINAPVAGTLPDYEAVCDSELYYVNSSAFNGGINWYWIDGNSERLMNAEERFEPGKKYMVKVDIKAADGYKFKVDDPMDPLKEVIAKIFVNGNGAEALSIGHDNYVLIGYEFGDCHDLVFTPSNFPSCDKTGNIGYYVCSCGNWYWDELATEPVTDKQEVVIPPTGAHKTTVVGAAAATCNKKGYTGDEVCSVCKTTIEKGTEIDFKAHIPVKDAAVAATYKTEGKTEGSHCKECNTVITAQKTVTKLTLGKTSGLKVKAVKLASDSKTTLTLAWTKVAGAEKYEVEQRVGKTWKYVGTTSKTSLTVKKLKANKSYKFRVRAVIDGVTPGAFSKTFTAKTVPLKTTLTLKAGKKQLTASWKTVPNITGYEVQYSTSKNFTKKTTKTVTIKKAKSKKTTIKKLIKGKKYFVRVRAYKTVGKTKIYSAWSSVKNVKVK